MRRAAIAKREKILLVHLLKVIGIPKHYWLDGQIKRTFDLILVYVVRMFNYLHLLYMYVLLLGCPMHFLPVPR